MMFRPAARLSALAALVLLIAPAVTVAQTAKPAPPPAKPATTKPGAAATGADAALGPQLVLETVKGTIVIQLFAKEAPKSVAQIVRLTKQGFYNQQRVIRVVQGQLVQFGDKQSRDATLREWWGRGANSGSGTPIGVAEISKTRKHRAGTLAMAHSGNPVTADSQMYITTRPMPNLDGKHAIIGQVIEGMAVVPKLERSDIIKKVTLKEQT
jgi:peptidyl-prolyl cis-trans isomerase B (cyclophilin B)